MRSRREGTGAVGQTWLGWRRGKKRGGERLAWQDVDVQVKLAGTG